MKDELQICEKQPADISENPSETWEQNFLQSITLSFLVHFSSMKYWLFPHLPTCAIMIFGNANCHFQCTFKLYIVHFHRVIVILSYYYLKWNLFVILKAIILEILVKFLWLVNYISFCKKYFRRIWRKALATRMMNATA